MSSRIASARTSSRRRRLPEHAATGPAENLPHRACGAAAIDHCGRGGVVRPQNRRASVAELGEVNWDAVAATDFRAADIKEGKQAEFLVHDTFSWHLVDRIGVYDRAVGQQAQIAMQGAVHRPVVEIRRDWYY